MPGTEPDLKKRSPGTYAYVVFHSGVEENAAPDEKETGPRHEGESRRTKNLD